MTTPLDQRILWMHWMGDKVGENDIRQLIATIKKYSPNVHGVAIKTSDGPLWQGALDGKKLLAVTGLRAIQKWVAELQSRQLEAHLWATLRGRHTNAETNLVVQACRVPGVKSMTVNVYVNDWWHGGLSAEDAEETMAKIREGLENGVNLGVAFDPRGDNLAKVYVERWAAYADTLHPRIFHWEYSEGLRGPEEYIDEAFQALSGLGKPIVPILQTHKDPSTQARVPENDVYDAGTYSFQKGAAGVMYYRLGAAGPLEFRGVSRVESGRPVSSAQPQPAAETPEAAAPPTSHPAPVPISEPVKPPPPDTSGETEVWVVIAQSLNVRSGPGLEPRLRVQGERLSMGEEVEILVDSLHDDEGYSWASLKNGRWVAYKTDDNSEVYMQLKAEVEAADEPPVQPAPSPAPEEDGKKVFLVVTNSLRVRSAPSTSGAPVDPSLTRGQQVEVDPDSRTEANGLVWWEHERGWSAERTAGGSEVFLLEHAPTVSNIPETQWKFQQLPVGLDVMQWFYYFGNTVYAFHNGRRWNYDGYSQGLHGGLDFGHRGGATVYAGVEGIFDGPGRAFGPNRVDVIVGDYRIIYGHLGSPENYPKGTRITPDMPVGKVESSLQHLHLEIRHQGRLIVNPLLFIDEQIRNDIVAKYPPTGQFGFYSSPRWQKWLTPLDQPTIVVGGPLIGPRAPQ